MEGKATTHGAATIVNGIACGRGAAFGIALETTAEVELTTAPGKFEVRIESDPGEETGLAEHCVRTVLARFRLANRYGAKITTRSRIPICRGLKSSSAAANAIVLATLKALGESLTDVEVLDLGVQAAFAAGVTITGAYDDACATYFGNVAVTDNVHRVILAQYPIEQDYEVVIHVPAKKIRKREVEVGRLKSIRAAAELAVRLTMDKDFRSGMLVNGLAYSAAMGLGTQVALAALGAGAVTAGVSGTGPATVVLVPPDSTDAVLAAIGACGGEGTEIIRTRLNREKAR